MTIQNPFHWNGKDTRSPYLVKMKTAFSLIVLLLLATGFIYSSTVFAGWFGGPKYTPTQKAARIVGGEARFSAATFDDGQARHYSIQTQNGMEIRYFIMKSSDGVIRAAFDACDVCWPAGKGYKQDGHEMICNNCGLRFSSVRINEVKGGCNPAPLNRRVENGEVVISLADIAAGSKYFDYK